MDEPFSNGPSETWEPIVTIEPCETCNHCEINESGDDGGIHDIFHNYMYK